jgi:hypothetical protein
MRYFKQEKTALFNIISVLNFFHRKRYAVKRSFFCQYAKRTFSLSSPPFFDHIFQN